MNRFSLLFIALATLALASCTDPVKGMVTDYISADLGEGTKVTEMQEAQAWTVADSLDVLQTEFNNLKAERVAQLDRAIESAEKAIESGEQVMNSGFSMLADQAELTVLEAKITLEKAKLEKASLDADCEGTSLKGLYDRIEAMKAGDKDEVLFQVLRGKAVGASGEEVPFDLIADKDMTKILGAFGE